MGRPITSRKAIFQRQIRGALEPGERPPEDFRLYGACSDGSVQQDGRQARHETGGKRVCSDQYLRSSSHAGRSSRHRLRDLWTAGVRIHWKLGEPKGAESNQPILIEILSDVPERFHADALAYAQSFGGVHIQVFYERLESRSSARETSILLAHVLVHEITHLLEGTNHHSKQGVMKARWTLDDLARMSWEPLPFDPEDIRLIHRGLAIRGT
jgi:hypothetical protein